MIAIMSARFSLGDHGAVRRPFAAGDVLFRQGDHVSSMFEVATGRVRLTRHGPDGRPAVLGRAGPGDLVAEASLFAEAYGCDAVSEEDGAALVVGRAALRRRLAGDPAALLALLERTAREVHALRARLELMGLPRVAGRLDAWLALTGGPEERTWKDVAAEIGVSPEALYRELARRRAVGRPLIPAPCPRAQ